MDASAGGEAHVPMCVPRCVFAELVFVLWRVADMLSYCGGCRLCVAKIVCSMVYSGSRPFRERVMREPQQIPSPEFSRFVTEAEPRLSYAFYAAYGPEVGADVTAEALAYAWENWTRIQAMDNSVGYLYRVGQSKARWYHRPRVYFPPPERSVIPEVEPKLPKALKQLTRSQRTSVVLVHALGWTEEEVAALTGRSRSTIRTHLERGLTRLRHELEVTIDA
jgi:DNA-directed RNA polymerase specialized sigma24 family protein